MHDGFTFDLVVMIMGLLFTASIVAILSRKVKLPFTILLVIIGLFMGWMAKMVPLLHPLTIFKLTPEVSMTVFLPALLFESAFDLDARKLIKNILPIMTLAVPALLISTFTVGFIVHYALSLPLGVALLFGALISATDPVAVVALFKEMGAPKRLTLLVEGESLFNDGTAVVLYKIILGVVLLGHFSAVTIASGIVDFVVVFTGGIAIGIVLGIIFSKIIEAVENDKLVEITLTTILAHSTFLAAEHIFHVSGIMATVAAGLTMGSYGRTKISPPVLEHMESFWEYFAFVCNSLIFLLVGLSIELRLFLENYHAILLGFFAILVARSIAVYSLFPLIGRFKTVEKVEMSFQTVIFWGGLRGSLAIAMALSLPDDLEYKPLILAITLGVVIFTLLVNGLTVRPLMGALGLNRYSLTDNFERLQAIVQAKNRAREDMLSFAAEGAIGEKAIEGADRMYGKEIESGMRELDEIRMGDGKPGSVDEFEMVQRHSLMLEKMHYHKLFEEGLLSENNLKDMIHTIENELDRLKEGREVMGTGERPSVFNLIGDYLFGAMDRVHLLKPLVRRYKTEKIAASYERKRARLLATAFVIRELEEMERRGSYSARALKKAKDFYEKLHATAYERLEQVKGEFPEYVAKVEMGILQRRCLNSELVTLKGLYSGGAISEQVFNDMEEAMGRALRKMKMRPVEELLLPPRELIAGVPCFRELKREELLRLTSSFSALSVLPGEEIVREGEKGDSLFIIGRGQVDVVTRDEAGKELRLARLKAGDFFGEIALLHPQPRTATVRADTPCTLLELSREKLMPYLEKAPHLKEILENAYRERMKAKSDAVHPAL